MHKLKKKKKRKKTPRITFIIQFLDRLTQIFVCRRHILLFHRTLALVNKMYVCIFVVLRAALLSSHTLCYFCFPHELI